MKQAIMMTLPAVLTPQRRQRAESKHTVKRRPATMVCTGIGEHAMRLVCLCASFSPALAGLPHLLEYGWNYLMSASRPTSK